MDIGRSFTYVLEDEEWWKKVLLGGLISLIPIVGQFFAMGYVLEVLGNVIAGRDTPLPEVLDDFGGRLVKGLLAGVIMLVYGLPLLIVLVCPAVGVPLASSASADPDTAGVIATVASICFGCLSALYGVVLGLVQPFAWGRYVETGQFGEAFKLGEIFNAIKENLGPAFIVLLVNALAIMLASAVGSILCGIGLFFTAFYAQLVMAYLFGSLYRQARPALQ